MNNNIDFVIKVVYRIDYVELFCILIKLLSYLILCMS